MCTTLKVFAKGKWLTYRLPKGAQTFDHAWNTEWMRIRDAQTERFLMDLHGIFYELPVQIYDGRILPIRPISNHLRIVPDFCYWRRLFVLGGDQTDRSFGQPQMGLWFGQVDDLWKMGKPAGYWYDFYGSFHPFVGFYPTSYFCLPRISKSKLSTSLSRFIGSVCLPCNTSCRST